MNSVEPNEIARPRAAEDAEPLWHVRFPTGMVTMTLDELDAAFQQGAINAQTFVAREDESQLRPLGVVAGLFEQEQIDTRHSEISGVRPAAYAHHPLSELAAHEPTWTLLDGPPQLEPMSRQTLETWESPALRCVRGVLSVRQWAANWFALRAPRERWALAALLVVSITSLIAWWPTKNSPPETVTRAALSAQPASEPRSGVPAALTAPQELPEPVAVPRAAPSRATPESEPAEVLAAPLVSESARRGSASAERRKSERPAASRRTSRKHRAWKPRAVRE
jgi:hypothetical protein